MNHRRRRRLAILAAGAMLALAAAIAPTARAQETPPPVDEVPPAPGTAPLPAEPEPPSEAALPPEAPAPQPTRLVLLPLEFHTARRLSSLARSLDELLSSRLEASREIELVDPARVAEATKGRDLLEAPDTELRELAERLDADAVLSGSVTELAGRYSLDMRLTPRASGARVHTVVFTADGEEELLQRMNELADRVAVVLARAGPPLVAEVRVEGAGDLAESLRAALETRPGEVYDPARARADVERMEKRPEVAQAQLATERTDEGMIVTFRVVRTEALGMRAEGEQGQRVADVRVTGNRRIEADAILARIATRPGEPLRPRQVADDVREVFALGFFRNVKVYQEDTPQGVVLTFEVEENPVVRQISISGNENLDADKIRDALTLTTGATLDYPLLYENRERIEALYRAEGYYLAKVSYQIEPLAESSVGVNFDVEEGEKLKLKRIVFEGNEHFSDGELSDGFSTKTWHFWSYATTYFDKSGTYSEPVFLQDLRQVEKKYTDDGYLQVQIGEPEVSTENEELVVTVPITEGPQFDVGELDVSGDPTVDIAALREKLQLKEGEVFNRSHLTEDVEALERHYTDRGFYFASVNPLTRIDEEKRRVDVTFEVQKGPLYFIRQINIAGNSNTVDSVIRREMRVVEGELYSARALQVSHRRIRQLGFFEDLSFEPKPTEDPSQLDLEVNVVERPTGSFSFGAGFSSQDGFVLTGALTQTNLFGRGYGVNLSADIGGRSDRFFLSFTNPYLLGSEFSLGATFFLTQLQFESFDERRAGFDLSLGHALREDNTARGFLRYSFSRRKVEQPTNVNAAAVIFRELIQGLETTSLVGASIRSDTRDDRFAPTQGTLWGATLDFAGLGGFSRFLRAEGQFAWYLGAPSWLFDRSTFVAAVRAGYTLPFNTISDYDLPGAPAGIIPVPDASGEVNVLPLTEIDTDLKLPLTERYFLGGLGTFQLRGYRARSVGPRRAILKRGGLGGTQDVFTPVGRKIVTDPVTGDTLSYCDDVPGQTINNQGNGNGLCNNISDKKNSDFADLDETDVVGGSSFISTSLEYRFPVSEDLGLQAILFLDMGNAFAEGDNLFDVTEWRYGTGGGLLWFSPFGPLQVVLGFPLNKLPIEDSPVFEFSVGGLGL